MTPAPGQPESIAGVGRPLRGQPDLPARERRPATPPASGRSTARSARDSTQGRSLDVARPRCTVVCTICGACVGSIVLDGVWKLDSPWYCDHVRTDDVRRWFRTPRAERVVLKLPLALARP